MTILLFAMIAGCVLQGDKYPRPRDLPSASVVDRTRVLAIRGDPPELAPGQTAGFEALLPDPDETVGVVLWVACPPERATPYGCLLDFGDLDLENASQDDLRAAGIIGVEPFWPPTYTPGPELLDGLDPFQRREGVQVTVQLLALPADAGEAEEIDFNEVESAFKRIVVSDEPAPNRNPDVTAFVVDTLAVPRAAVLEVDARQSYRVDVLLADDAIETYTYVDRDGAEEQRTEEPYVTWYATEGGFSNPWGLHPFTGVDWTAPREPGATGSLYAVVRDRRGGMAWWEQAYRVR